jgi:NAD(P)-dependent dehydrogenase (short-subunit alcohol dehydrogenase family)
MGKLDGQVAVITGGSIGIGLATAQLFAKERAEVVITGRHQAALMAMAAHVELVPIEQVTPDHLDGTFNTNARGTLFTVKKKAQV